MGEGKITVYSSYPIREGIFITPSKMYATDYAGGNPEKVYSKVVDVDDVAWLYNLEGQYAPLTDEWIEEYKKQHPDNQKEI